MDASSKKGKQAFIFRSSSDSEEEDESEAEEEEEDSEEEDDVEGSLSEDGSESIIDYEEEDDEEEDEEDDDDPSEGKPTNEELCNRVVDLLQRRRNLNTLKLEECKAFLRKHELRLSGTKATCIERILEHWRLKDGNGEKLYPRASFVINCTGDVCTGDVILFKQRVYEKFDIVTRGGSIIGKRIIAGRVVKESYGAAKQQHTFTVEILWSKGVKALPPLFALLVKGRNLYRLKTFRQETPSSYQAFICLVFKLGHDTCLIPAVCLIFSHTSVLTYKSDVELTIRLHNDQRWSNEQERSKVLAEKHKRGAAARQVRANAKARSANRGSKRQRNSSTARAPPNKRRKKEAEPAATRKRKQQTPNGPSKMKQAAKTRGSSATHHPKHTNYHENGIHHHTRPYHHHHNTEMELHRRRDLPNHYAGYSSSAATGASHPHMLNRGEYMSNPYANPTSQFDPRRRSSNQFFREMHFDGGPTLPLGEQFHGWRWP